MSAPPLDATRPQRDLGVMLDFSHPSFLDPPAAIVEALEAYRRWSRTPASNPALDDAADALAVALMAWAAVADDEGGDAEEAAYWQVVDAAEAMEAVAA